MSPFDRVTLILDTIGCNEAPFCIKIQSFLEMELWDVSHKGYTEQMVKWQNTSFGILTVTKSSCHGNHNRVVSTFQYHTEHPCTTESEMCIKAPTSQQQQHRPQLLERVKRQQLNTPTQQEQHSCCYWHWEPAWLYCSLQGTLKDLNWWIISTPDSV